jgi:hypothetical protein
VKTTVVRCKQRQVGRLLPGGETVTLLAPTGKRGGKGTADERTAM